jgi:hypothetical protein
MYVANSILIKIEIAGMLPPFSNDVFYNKWSKTKDSQTNGNDWDPETENIQNKIKTMFPGN